ncbi:NAD-dependent aldehyde dehydrogenase [Kickxella alabastrina]|uniref:NAD-dependent aldehyde dehydrogenase n=1 Tax=Kickxella alabastrina TaxID=61397 RepID=UPI00221EBF52|nr:NAD-dependent aldehyde dehydrogenase [Kickxella alabastrina]KAI7825924.1 NAD-dependent aldehyde dehydrogenase [Kickxella alabastrina]
MSTKKEYSTISGGSLNESALEYTELSTISTAVDELRTTFATHALRPLPERKQQLRSLLQGLRTYKKALLDAVYLDLHKSATETDFFEYSAVEFDIGLALDNLDKWAQPDRHPLAILQPAFLMSRSEVRKEPLGTVLILGAWNYPLRLLLLPLVGALAAGNTAVVKPSELAPHTAVVVGQLIEQFLDPRFVRVMQGGVLQATELLRQHFDHYFFTGNGTVGRIVAKAAAEHLSGVTLELGGKSPAVVHADTADLSVAAYRIMWAKLANAGQTCVTVDYVLVHRSVKDELVEHLLDAAVAMFGTVAAASPDYGRIINKRNWRRLRDLLDRTEGQILGKGREEPVEEDLFFPPTIVDGVLPSDSLMSEELFGPILPIVTYDTLEEALALVNSRDQPLALYVFGSAASSQHVLANTRSGVASVNDTMFLLGSHGNPFGGVGPSGLGRYTGKFSFETFSHHRYVLLRPMWFPNPGMDTVAGYFAWLCHGSVHCEADNGPWPQASS